MPPRRHCEIDKVVAATLSKDISYVLRYRVLPSATFDSDIAVKMWSVFTQPGVWGFVALSVVVWALFSFRDYFRLVWLCWRLPGPTYVPILGNCLLIKEKHMVSKYLAPAYSLYGPLIRVWILLFPFLVVLQPEDLQLILSSKRHTDKTFFYRLMHNFLGNGLITSNGDRWSFHRRLIQPTFHLSILERFIDTFADASQALCETLQERAMEEIDIGKYANVCVMDILNEAVLGVPIKKKSNIDMAHSPFRQGKVVVPQRFLRPWLLLDSVYRLTKLSSEEQCQKNRLNEFTRMMVRRRRGLLASCEEPSKKCLLDYMINISDSNVGFTEEDIIDEACTFMLAGQDSVGAALAFALFLLAQNQDCQQKCCLELEHIFRGDKRTPTMQDLREMRYLEMCIKETLRLYPSVPVIARKLGEEVRLANGVLPAGSNVFISPFSTHRLPHIYPDPERFDPERFAPDSTEHRHPYAYLPFSAGPRYCIGNRFAIMELKTVISAMLRHYEILPVPGKTTVHASFRITLRASGGLWLRLRRRSLPEPARVSSITNDC